MEIRKVSGDDYETFLRERQYAVVLFGAPWDVGPGAMIRPRFEKAARIFTDRVNFGEVNCDEFVRVATSLRLANVPGMAYYKNGQPIAVLIGGLQDVAARTQALLNGQRIGPDDGWNTDEEGKAYHSDRRPRCSILCGVVSFVLRSREPFPPRIPSAPCRSIPGIYLP
jgi:thioredoxin-like negative regulator of GroEL